MSIENAERFVALLGDGDEAANEIVSNSGAKGSALEETAKVTAAATAAGWDFTAAELKEAIIASLAIDDAELNAVAGGVNILGKCTDDYYEEACTDTVEQTSYCWTGDWCYASSSTYTCTDSACEAKRHRPAI